MDGERLSDLYAIHQLKSRYFRYLDTKQWDLWRPLFADDLLFFAEESVFPKATTPSQTGGDNFVEYVSNLLETAISVHHGHMPDIEFQSDHEATGVWAMYDWVDDPDKGFAIQGFGHYHEKYRKGADGNWQIADMRLTRLRTTFIEPTRPGGDRPWPSPWTAPHPGAAS